MTKNYDLVIVGAGPAGSAAAIAASEGGVSVLLLEEHPEIGTPLACAEGLSRSTIKGWLDVKPEWIAQSLSGSIIRDPEGNEFTIQYPNVGWILNRKVFDPALAQLAAEKGADVRKSTKVVGIEGDRVVALQDGKTVGFGFKYLIGADGISSNVGRWLGIDTKLNLDEIEICAEYLLSDIKVDPGFTTLILGADCAPGGYAWIFPKSASSANVGLGLSPIRTKDKPKFLLDRWIKREFPHANIEEEIFGGVPARILERFSGANFCLVGDAARFTDPLSGAGIANGIKSGMIAGRNAVKIIKGQKDHLEREMRKEILDEIRWHYRVRKIYVDLTDADLGDVFKIGERLFHGKTVSDINTRQLIKKTLLLSPHLLRLGFRLLF